MSERAAALTDETAERNLAARHVALSLAVRARDPLAAARAASRLRIPGAFMTVREFTTARRARAAVGAALVRARVHGPAGASRAAIPVEALPEEIEPRILRRQGRPVWRALAVIAVVALLVVLFRPGGGFFGGGSSEQEKQSGVTVPANATLRGRTLGQASAVVVQTPQPTTTPPVIIPGASTTPNPIGGQGGGSPVPGGGGGFGSPGPGATPSTPPLGFGRLTVYVTDASSGQPLRNVCVSVGSNECKAFTDQQGKWSADIQLPAPRVPFDLAFSIAAYQNGFTQTTLIQGQEVIVRIGLKRA